ncbi:MAG: pantetheine-phosphate adenylyltransferase [Clostridia bacterium]|nr:pantetheine-phosphate adenylyltransferase [Clostridia bacterium]
MRRAIYPGTFDPVTNGHFDIAERASGLFDEVIIAVANDNYKNNLFNTEERIFLLESVTKDMKNVRVAAFEGLLMDFANNQGANVVVRGLRAISDFEFEFQLSLMNKKLNDKVETVFFMTANEYSFISSSIIKQVASLGGSVCGLVPPIVSSALIEKYNQKLKS